ncbi:hypothetical protein [Hydrogenophaga sp. BPS33]|uniref:hypothetical protein n=1 Tax=Hydrogenophaga sp. BPS33 TaxID=2651974 RepID=UPI00131FB5CE|nr:hypothetical protein [Hydrogenophaga sp. BPS33]QHE87760.1 hypothetical protein F9K07_24120 [Hydrogenophaga sp. BPS33]
MMPARLARLPLYGLLALIPWTVCAQAPTPDGSGHTAQDTSDWGPLTRPATPTRGIRKLGDGELSCAQIYVETQGLEKALQDQQAQAAQAQEAMALEQKEMMQQASGMRGSGIGSAIGGSLLGMIPGGAQVQGYAMQAAAEARRTQMQESMQKMMQAQQQLVQQEQDAEQAQARSDHLADLFIRKGCKLSEVRASSPIAAP